LGENNNNYKRWYKYGMDLINEINNSEPCNDEIHIWFAGQHGFIIKTGKKIIFIDVILNDFMGKDGISRRVYPPPFAPDQIKTVDLVLCSHNHGDHLNMQSLLPMYGASDNSFFIVPEPSKNVLLEGGMAEKRIIPAKALDEIKPFSDSDIQIIPVPAIHTKTIQNDGEKDNNGNYTSLGYIIKTNGISIYHAGDTWVTPLLLEILKEQGPLDLAMLPINGTDWQRTMENCIGNMGFLDAVKLAKAVPIDLVIPSHYDMMAFNSENPAKFADSMYALCPEKRFHISALGERFIYRK